MKESVLRQVDGLGTEMSRPASMQQKKRKLRLQLAWLCGKSHTVSREGQQKVQSTSFS
jgi:hypothetical protein